MLTYFILYFNFFFSDYFKELRCLQNPVKKWMTLQPENWTSNEVIDWLYCFADQNSIDCSTFRAEAFQDKIGQDLCFMHQEQFEELDPIYGKQIYDTFKCLLGSCKFIFSSLLLILIMSGINTSFYYDLYWLFSSLWMILILHLIMIGINTSLYYDWYEYFI